jgi:cytidylate kinase
LKQGVEISLEQVLVDIKTRDHNDTSREHSPLIKAEDAIEIDTTHLTIHQQADEIVSMINI